MRAALYLRSSKDRSDVSIDAQRRQLQEMAAVRGITIVAEFADAVESGKDDDRPGFQDMLRALRNHKRGWDAVLALDTARIARRRHLAIIFEEHEAKRAGVRVIYKSLPESDPITEMLLKSILQAMDEWHSLTSKAKGLAGMAENVRQGFRAGGVAPKGYRLDTIATGAIRDGAPVTKSKLVPSDDAMLVRAFLQARARGEPRARALAAIKQSWPVTTCLSIERNALTYAGHTVWNRHAEAGSSSKFRPRAEWVIQRDTHEPLISETEAEAILDQIEAKKRTRTRQTPFLLTGLLFSPDGEKWHASGDGFYRLGKGRRIKAEEVDRAIMRAVARDLVSDNFAAAMLKHYQALAKPAERDRDIAKMQARVAEIDKQTEKLANLLPETTAQAALLRSIEKLEAEREKLIGELEARKSDSQTQAALRKLTVEDVKRFLAGIADQMEGETEFPKNPLAGIIESVTLDPATFSASVAYKLGQLTGDKVASPRGFEPRLSP